MVILVALLVLSWLVAFSGYVGALSNLSGKTPWRAMFVSGFRMFDKQNFTNRGLVWRKVYLGALAALLVFAIAFVVVSS